METKHTPGPWNLIEKGDANMYGMVTVGNKWVISFQQNGELMTDTQMANAKLIAAAPDLLKALVDMVNADLDDTGFAEHNKVIASRNAKAAIKKATE
jgi:hypothetical protein